MRDVRRASHELRRSESKKAKLEELSININERLTERIPASECSERASGYATDSLLSERSEVSGESGVYYIIGIPAVKTSRSRRFPQTCFLTFFSHSSSVFFQNVSRIFT